jgi:hypothetical protein
MNMGQIRRWPIFDWSPLWSLDRVEIILSNNHKSKWVIGLVIFTITNHCIFFLGVIPCSQLF